jgi:carboxypeptidase C (cathepsin A)
MNERSGINAYDITKDGAVIEGISIIDDFFSNDTNIDHYGFEKDNNYETMSQLVYTKFANDFMKEEVASVEYLLNEGISVLVYQGQDDGYINTAGTIKWVEELNYANAEQFRNARFEGWRIDDRMLMLGSKKSAGNLTLVIVNNAGHFVPQDNPESALYMLRNFLYNTK